MWEGLSVARATAANVSVKNGGVIIFSIGVKFVYTLVRVSDVTLRNHGTLWGISGLPARGMMGRGNGGLMERVS